VYCQLFSAPGLLLSILAVSLQPLSYLFGLRMLFLFLLLLSHPLLLLEAALFFPL
jgi:hypothetical protein